MKRFRKKTGSIGHKLFSLILAIIMLTSTIFTAAPITTEAATTITSMSYYSGNGPIISKADAKQADYGFVMPVFNGGAATWEEVVDDLMVNVKVNGQWIDIDKVDKFVYDSNWGHWFDAGYVGYWFVLSETTEIQLASKANPGVTLDYTLEFTKLPTTNITSMTATQGPVITAGVTGGSGFTYPTFNGDSSIVYSQVADDLTVFAWSDDSQSWVNLDGNASSGWIYDQNWGQFTDGPGGYWFTVEKTTKIRLASKSNTNVYLDYTINYSEPVRNSYTISANGATSFEADKNGAIGVPLPLIDGGNAVKSELDGFVYEILINDEWVALSDSPKSGFSYRANGYSNSSPANQWGYWADGIYGLWFQPIQVDMKIRIGYPTDGVAGNAVNDNYVYYTFIGNPDAPRPDPDDYKDIELGTVNNAAIDGWNLIWNDEFNGNSLDTTKWSYQIGNGLTASGNTGWGNNELQYYTDSTDNVYVSDGKLNITTLNKTVYDPAEGTFNYTSGRIRTVSDDKTSFSFKYGRVDFCAKLPAGAGTWPALWMLPSDPSIYGVWAASGEIDVMEARGRLTNTVCGTIHYGGTWPNNTYTTDDYYFSDGKTFDSDYHVYSLVWEQDKLKWYVDGKCYLSISNDVWFSSAASGNPYAPFDQEFYIIMNLAAGGKFDGGIVPDSSLFPTSMQVEYVRVYQAEENNLGTYTDNSSGIDHSTGGTTNPPIQQTTEAPTEAPTQAPTEAPTQAPTEAPTQAPTEAPTEAPTTEAPPSDASYGMSSYSNGKASFFANNADWAIIHYTVNGGGDTNIGMNSTSDANSFTYDITGLNPGDVIKYSFTYKPADGGALDTETYTFTVPSNGEEETEASTESDKPYGMSSYSNGTATFFANDAEWTIIHYNVNNGGDINIGMDSISGTNSFTYDITGLNPRDVIKYSFTYKPVNGGALDSKTYTFTVPSTESATAKVTFMNGSETYSTDTVTKGSKAELPKAPAKDGSLFIGWFTENIGTISSVNDSVLAKAYDTNASVNSDTTLYAGWLSTGTVEKDSNDNITIGSDNSGFYLIGAQYRKQTDSVSAGLRFMARISTSLVESVETLNPANASLKPDSSTDTGIGYGMVVTTANRLSDTNMLVKDLSAASVASGMKVCPAVNTYRKYNDYSIFTAVVTGITEASYDVNIAARMYITYVDANGIEQTYYYTENESSSTVGGAYYTTYRKVLNAAG